MMIETKPEVSPTGLYNQTQAAAALHIHRHTLVNYAQEGLIKFKIRKAGMRKVCTGADIIKCWSSMYLG